MADSKIRVVLVSHGEQSKGMLNTVQMLLGEQTNIAGTNLAMLMTIVLERDFEGATCEGLCEAAINAAADSYVDVRKMLMDSDDDEEDE